VAPQTQYVAPQTPYVAPQTQYVDPQIQYLTPQIQYVDPQTQYLTPQIQYVASNIELLTTKTQLLRSNIKLLRSNIKPPTPQKSSRRNPSGLHSPIESPCHPEKPHPARMQPLRDTKNMYKPFFKAQSFYPTFTSPAGTTLY
jgi:hypothetical protein